MKWITLSIPFGTGAIRRRITTRGHKLDGALEVRVFLWFLLFFSRADVFVWLNVDGNRSWKRIISCCVLIMVQVTNVSFKNWKDSKFRHMFPQNLNVANGCKYFNRKKKNGNIRPKISRLSKIGIGGYSFYGNVHNWRSLFDRFFTASS